ncbi:SMI1/KNR4 family protein [Acinetobacter sp. C26M]|uniref:SMI1/KNR4 family protein n=1 Tax=unclassified Acinetobacter TaxID=196816 RepID=UPI0020373449|nr:MULTISPECIES: SMI1/KNR4 family protein [unclassified Acinetobacter]USA45607.1 SMI1/KNR4 family protein [Acinetobacter sp. C26M]USA49107.1 SMI1/KNR4 family protein [Acinetobacter sp. C26G]
MNVINKIKSKLQKQNVRLNTPATWQDILAFEYKYQVKLSPILRTYFLEFNGIADRDMDDKYFTFLSLTDFQSFESIASDYDKDKYLYPNCFVFSDYLVWCWGYVVQLDQLGLDSVVYQVGGAEKTKIADSFTAFLNQYLIDSDELL